MVSDQRLVISGQWSMVSDQFLELWIEGNTACLTFNPQSTILRVLCEEQVFVPPLTTDHWIVISVFSVRDSNPQFFHIAPLAGQFPALFSLASREIPR